MNPIVVHKHRTVTLPVSLPYDVSQDFISSDIRKGRTHDSELICSWEVTKKTDGSDGELIFTLDDGVTETITDTFGYMDIKRVSNGEPIAVLMSPIVVEFREVVTS